MRPHLLFLCDGQAYIAREVLSHLAHQNRARKGTGKEPQARKTMQDNQARRKKGLRDELHGFSGAIGKFKVSGMLHEHQASVAVPER